MSDVLGFITVITAIFAYAVWSINKQDDRYIDRLERRMRQRRLDYSRRMRKL